MRGAVSRALRPSSSAPRGPAAWLALYGAAALVAYTAAVLYLGQPVPDVAGVRLLGAVARAAVSAGFWTAASLLAFRAGFLQPVRRPARLAVTCAAAGVAVSLLFNAQAVLYCELGWGLCGNRAALFLISLPLALLMSTSLACFGQAYAGAARHREEEIRADRLDADLARAQLDALAVQLRPHFLFNTLQSVATLMHRDAAAAQAMLGRLGLLLEASTRAAEASELPLDEELELLGLYTSIEAVRFGERLRVEVAVGPGAGRALVPHLLLQPLVENAVRYAVARRGEGRIEVRAEVRGEAALALEVRDNGAGLPSGCAAEGVGLANTRERLRTLYGAEHEMELESRPGEGLTVRIRIPLRYGADERRTA